MKLRDDENSAKLKIVPGILLLGSQVAMPLLSGDVPPLQVLLHRHLFVLQPRSPGLKVQFPQKSDLGLWLVVDGERGKLRKRLALEHLLPLRSEPPESHSVRMTIALNLYQRKGLETEEVRQFYIVLVFISNCGSDDYAIM